MKNPADIARSADFELETVDAEPFELCFDLYGSGWLLATFLYDGKPQNAYTDMSDCDEPVGWCIRYSDELHRGEPAVRSFCCNPVRIDLATAMACGMVQERLIRTGWWKPLPGHRLWDEREPGYVKPHTRFELDPPPRQGSGAIS